LASFIYPGYDDICDRHLTASSSIYAASLEPLYFKEALSDSTPRIMTAQEFGYAGTASPIRTSPCKRGMSSSLEVDQRFLYLRNSGEIRAGDQ
jgi:hypothetical protein